MKKILLLVWALILPLPVLGHGGVSKTAGRTTVYLNQTPLSPLVGEEVTMVFVIRGVQMAPLANWPVALTLTEIPSTNPEDDRIVETHELQTDPNGSLEYRHTFTNDHYFDVDLAYQDPASEETVTTGFLLQPRADKSSATQLLLAAVLGVLVGVVVSQLTKKRA